MKDKSDNNEIVKQAPTKEKLAQDQSPSVDESRRSLTKASLAAPVLMSLASRPVLAGGAYGDCSLSGFMSGNVSNHKYKCTPGFGCTPGYWKNHPAVWLPLTAYSPGKCLKIKIKWDLVDCTEVDTNTGSCTKPKEGCDVWDMSFETGGATTFLSVFGRNSAYFLSDDTASLMEVLQSAEGSLDFHACAAVLNAAAYPIEYGASVAQIVDAYNKALDEGDGQKGTLHDILDAMNNRDCPIDSFGRCESGFVKNVDDVCIPAVSGKGW